MRHKYLLLLFLRLSILFFPLPQCACGFINGCRGARSPIFLSHFPSPFFYIPSPLPVLPYLSLSNLGFGLAGPYPRVHFALTATQAPSRGRGRTKSEFVNVVQSGAGALTADSNAVQSKVPLWRRPSPTSTRSSAITCFDTEHKQCGQPSCSFVSK